MVEVSDPVPPWVRLVWEAAAAPQENQEENQYEQGRARSWRFVCIGHCGGSPPPFLRRMSRHGPIIAQQH